MKRMGIVVSVAASLMFGAFAAQAKLPPAPPKTEAEKAAAAEKAKAAAAKEGEELAQAMDRAVANYRKNKGMEEPKPAHAEQAGKKK
jgi:Na+-transporting methylmalonyl-CoA/oxaloacetate decarboxylase gamma subunit